MTITRIESTLIPNTLEGKAFAKEYQDRLKQQGAFRKWQEDSTSIIITAEYHLDLKAETEAQDGQTSN